MRRMQRNRKGVKLTSVIVTKVGRKYFTCKEKGDAWYETQYHLDTWREKTDYSEDSCLYSNPQEWEDEREASKLCKVIWYTFEYGNNKQDIPLSGLRVIADIIEGETGT